MIRRPPRSTLSSSSAASDVYKRQFWAQLVGVHPVDGSGGCGVANGPNPRSWPGPHHAGRHRWSGGWCGAPYDGQVTLHLFDSATRSLRPFEPLEPAKASIYVCGATVQGPPHIGHIRSGVNFDILQRWLARCGYEVTFVRNVTDIDDKILIKSAAAGRPWSAWAAANEHAFARAYDALGCLLPTYE